MNLAIVMRREVLDDKLEDGRVHRRAVATWNTRRLPTRLTPGWTNRLNVACQGRWRGYFPLAGDVFWNLRLRLTYQDESSRAALEMAPPRHRHPVHVGRSGRREIIEQILGGRGQGCRQPHRPRCLTCPPPSAILALAWREGQREP